MPDRLAAATARVLLGLILVAAAFAPSAARAGGKKTHLGVPVNQIVNIRTEQIANDNAGGALFRYDREGDPFVIPDDFSFVVTDILVEPTTGINTTDPYLVVVNLGGRLFQARFVGAQTQHYELGGAMVMPGGAVPEARNTTSSTGPCEVQILGYFIKGRGLNGGEALFPPPAP